VVAALAAWQFSGRRDPAVVEQASAASAPASSVIAAPAPPAPEIIIETPEPSPTSTLANDAIKSPPVPPVPSAATAADTTARAASADRATMPDAGAASGPRIRPPGKPVPPVGQDPAMAATNGIGTTRPPEAATTASPTPSTNGHLTPSMPPSRDGGTVQRPTAGGEYGGGASIRDVCKGSFFERNVCLDQRCEEARFRSTPECIDVLDRKRKRLSQ